MYGTTATAPSNCPANFYNTCYGYQCGQHSLSISPGQVQGSTIKHFVHVEVEGP